MENIWPVISDEDKLVSKIKEGYNQVSQGKDVIIMEGVCDQSLVEALDARAIIVEDYSKGLSRARLNSSYQDWGEHLLGIVFNKIPLSRLNSVRNEITFKPGEDCINIMGVLPEDRILFTISVDELAKHLKGKY